MANLALVASSPNTSEASQIIPALNSLVGTINNRIAALTVATAAVGNGADTTEDTLQTFSLPPGYLAAAGQALRITARGKCAGNTDNKTMRLYFGSEVIATPTAATNGKNWSLELIVVKTGASTQQVNGIGIVDTTAVTPYDATGAETDTSAITIKCTGQAGTGNASDIVCDCFIVEALR